MPKAQAAAVSAIGASASPVREAPEALDINKPINTQLEKTTEGRSATAETSSVGEGPAGLAARDEKTHGDERTDNPKRIQLVAYQLWLDRGSPIGSPEVDWVEAIRICRDTEV